MALSLERAEELLEIAQQREDAHRASLAELEAQAEIYRKNTTNLLEEIERQVERDRAAEHRAATLQADLDSALHVHDLERKQFSKDIATLQAEVERLTQALAESERKRAELLAQFSTQQ